MSFWGSILKVAVPAAVSLYGMKTQSDANDEAAEQATRATQASTKAQTDALRIAEQNLEKNRQAASPGLMATQEIITRGSDLTPEQEMAVENSRRQSLNA